MNSNRYKSMRQANILFENRFLVDKGILKEYDQKSLENKRSEILSKLGKLKEAQKGMFASVKKSKINDYITDLQNVNLNNVCEGTNLKGDLQTKLNDAKKGLEQYKDQIDDPENLLPSLTSDISIIENFCKTESSSTPTQTQVKTGEETKPQDNLKTQTTNNLDSFKNMKFLDALNKLNSDEKFTKKDIVDYVISRVTIKTN